jgi:hypothetical protein
LEIASSHFRHMLYAINAQACIDALLAAMEAILIRRTIDRRAMG